MTRFILRHGFSHGSTIDLSCFGEEIRSLPCNELRYVISRLMFTQDSHLVEIKRDLLNSYQDNEYWHDKGSAFVIYVVYRVGVGYSMPDYLIRHHDYCFLKKLPARMNMESAQTMSELAREWNERCEFDLYDEVIEELEAVGTR